MRMSRRRLMRRLKKQVCRRIPTHYAGHQNDPILDPTLSVAELAASADKYGFNRLEQTRTGPTDGQAD